MISELYSIEQCEIVRQTGYEDMNFCLQNIITPRDELRKQSKFILKITNPIEARNYDLMVDNILVLFSVRLPVRLFEFLNGTKLEDVDYSMQVCNLIGRLLAQFHMVTSTFDDDAYRRHIPFLSLENRECCEREMELLFERNLISESQHELLKRTLDIFKKKMSKMSTTMAKGFIHSDFNETNILVEISNDEYVVKGLLDFGDAHYSYLIFDIAAAILYVLMDTKTNEYDDEWLKLGGWVVNGYETVHTVMDKDMLLPSMRARLALSLIYGLRTARINYRNGNLEYVLKTQNNGWKVLKIAVQVCSFRDSTMKTHLLVTFATLAYAASENKDVPIEKCAVSIDGVKRPSVLPSLCKNTYADIPCAHLYPVTDNSSHHNELVVDTILHRHQLFLAKEKY
ncbi:unnamed protein product [Toxocara canis]|uniref:Hydroxylysine kinase n=1 Tax=Toxocara canis TaxID=6265 RepID=A0A183UVN2_TOXCA|nr:unnamed protein product [Toxocara canis]